MYHFCTYFDSNYFLRGLTLYRSLTKTDIDFTLYILCLDDQTRKNLSRLNLDNIVPIPLTQLEQWEPELLTAKSNRSLVEYYFTLTPSLPLYVLETYQHVDIITYLDADLYFYQSPEPLLDELHNHSILVTEHRFPPYLKEKEKYGHFNVQFEAFRRDKQGLQCLKRWKQQCIEWCYDRLDGARFADQKYLDEWPDRYDQLAILKHKGGGVAPWNWATYPMKTNNKQLYVDDQPIIFYHFHGIKIIHPCLISNGLLDFGLMPRKFRNLLYKNYIAEIKSTQHWLLEQGILISSIVDRAIRGGSIRKVSNLVEIIKKIPSQIMFTCGV